MIGDYLGEKPYLASIKNENLVLIPIELGYHRWDYYDFQFLVVYEKKGNERPSSFG